MYYKGGFIAMNNVDKNNENNEKNNNDQNNH